MHSDVVQAGVFRVAPVTVDLYLDLKVDIISSFLRQSKSLKAWSVLIVGECSQKPLHTVDGFNALKSK